MLRSFGVIALTLSAACAYAGSCEDMLFGEDPEHALPEDSPAAAAVDVGATESFISYLELLIEEKVLSFAELESFDQHLVDGQLVNPLSLAAKLSSARHLHLQALEAFLPRENVDLTMLRAWVDRRVRGAEQTRIAREHVRAETQSAAAKLALGEIPGGGFEMMLTDVTQLMWIERTGENPSHFKDGPFAVTLSRDGREHVAQPDNPVESITWWSALMFANRESEARGLKPAYDLSGITWREGTRMEDGTLAPVSEEEGHEKVRYTSLSGQPDDTEGLRLPTQKEWDYLTENYLRKLPRSIDNYGSFKKNGVAQTTQPTGSAEHAVVIDGQEFHDLVGNVWKYLSDWRICGRQLPPEFEVLMAGGSYNQPTLSYWSVENTNGFARKPTRGLRLVRTLPHGPQ